MPMLTVELGDSGYAVRRQAWHKVYPHGLPWIITVHYQRHEVQRRPNGVYFIPWNGPCMPHGAFRIRREDPMTTTTPDGLSCRHCGCENTPPFLMEHNPVTRKDSALCTNCSQALPVPGSSLSIRPVLPQGIGELPAETLTQLARLLGALHVADDALQQLTGMDPRARAIVKRSLDDARLWAVEGSSPRVFQEQG